MRGNWEPPRTFPDILENPVRILSRAVAAQWDTGFSETGLENMLGEEEEEEEEEEEKEEEEEEQ